MMGKKLCLLGVLAILTFVVANCGDNTMVECKNDDNGKVPDPGGEFLYDRVSVVLTEEASFLDKVWVPSDFPEFAFSEIYMGFIGLQCFLFLYLTEPSRDNVLRAIYKLKARTEVYIADVAEDGRVPDPGGEFEYGRVMVVLTEEASISDKIWAPSDFPEFAFSEVENIRLTDRSVFYLHFHLTEPSRDNVLRAIYILRSRSEVWITNVLRRGGPGGGGGGGGG